MAQLNITLNQDEILQLLNGDREGAFKMLLQESLNSILKAESKEQLKCDTLFGCLSNFNRAKNTFRILKARRTDIFCLYCVPNLYQKM